MAFVLLLQVRNHDAMFKRDLVSCQQAIAIADGYILSMHCTSHAWPDCTHNAGLAGQVHSSEQDGGYQAHGSGKLWRQLGEYCCQLAGPALV